MPKLKLGELDAQVFGGEDRQGGGTGPVVVLMHGFGAPGTDLVPLYRQVRVPPEVRFVFPEAPLALDVGETDFSGRAWWIIDMLRLQMAAISGRVFEFVNDVPAGLSLARDKVLTMIEAIEQELGVKSEQIVMGGFSQGAMLATDVVLRDSRKFAGLVVLSGALIASDEWLPLMKKRAGMHVLQSHGQADPILPFAVGDKLRAEFVAAGLAVEFTPFSGGHGIPDAVLQRLGGFVSEVTAQKGSET